MFTNGPSRLSRSISQVVLATIRSQERPRLPSGLSADAGLRARFQQPPEPVRTQLSVRDRQPPSLRKGRSLVCLLQMGDADLLVIELQDFSRLTTAKARCQYQPEIDSGGHAATRYAIAIDNHALLDRPCTDQRKQVAKPPMACRIVAVQKSATPITSDSVQTLVT